MKKFKINKLPDFEIDKLSELRYSDPVSTAFRQQVRKFNDELDEFTFNELSNDSNYILIKDIQRIESGIEYEIKFSIQYITSDSIPLKFTGKVIDLRDIRSRLYQSDVDYKNMSFKEFKRIVTKVFK